MRHESRDVFPMTYEERAAIIRRAEAVRAQEVGRAISALWRGVRRVFADLARRGKAGERVDIPRSTSSAIF